MPDDEEVLELGRRPINRRVWFGALAVALLGLGAVVVVRAWPHSSHRPLAVADSTAVAHPSAPASATQPWPTARRACGGTIALPIVTSVPVQRRTGLHLLVGGSRLSSVDFDSGAAVDQDVLRPGEGVVDFVGRSPCYALVARCDWRRGMQLIRLGSQGRARSLAVGPSVDAVYADGSRLWAVTAPSARRSFGFARRFGGGRRVRLPTGFSPEGITAGVFAGEVVSGAFDAKSVVLVDAATGRVRARLGIGQVLAVGHGLVVWAGGCDPDSVHECVLHWRGVADGSTSGTVIPRAPGFGAAALSDDGRLLAFPMVRTTRDPRYQDARPFPPLTVAVLDLDTGLLQVAHGIEIPLGTVPGLAFSAGARWLVIALDAGTRTRLLAWQPGMVAPYETATISGWAVSPPPILVLPSAAS